MDSFLFYANGRYFKLALILVLIATGAYIWHQPTQPANGGTWLGYTLGTISALLIVWLMYFGRRKRDYSSSLGTVKGWLSAHVHLGTGLLIIGTLHTGFQFGFNVHTLAYALMCFVIITGLYGAWAYIYIPMKKRNNLSELTSEEHFQLIDETDKQIKRLTTDLPPELTKTVNSAIQLAAVGGSLLQQISGSDHSSVKIDGQEYANIEQAKIIQTLAVQLSKAENSQQALTYRKLIDLFTTRKQSLAVLRKDIHHNALLKVWLLCHIPASFALFVTLFIHILTVFIYW